MNRQLVKAIRDMRGLNQYSFSELIGVSRTTISYIEAGYISVSPETQRKIIAAVGSDFVAKVAELIKKQ